MRSCCHEDFQSIESVSASPFHEEVSYDAMKLKKELHALEERISDVKRMMADEFEEYTDPQLLAESEFNKRLANENISSSLSQEYLTVKEDFGRVKAQLGELSSAVFSEVSTLIKLPKAIDVTDDMFIF